MKARILLFMLLLFSMSLCAQSEKDYLLQAAKQESELNDQAAFISYQQVLKLNASNYLALWKMSELYSRLGKKLAGKTQHDYFNLAKSFAQRAIQVNPNGADGYYALSVAMGRQAQVLSGKERVRSAKEIRSNAEKAIALNPRHARAWHVLGKWHYEVSNLNMFERAALKVMYGGLPSASLKESIQAYEHAKQLEPDFSLNYMELAKAYHRDDQEQRAIDLLKRIPSLPYKTSDEGKIRAEAAKLLKDWTD